MNPFDLRGPEFLTLYVFLFLGILGLAAALRWHWRQPADEPGPEALDLAPFEVAYLAGGPTLAVNAAIARLVHEGALTVNASDRKLLRKEGGALSKGASRLEKAVFCEVDPGSRTGLADVRQRVASDLEPIRQRLQHLGLVVADDGAVLARFVPLLLLLVVPAFGFIKIMVGLSRDRPVSFLVVLCIVSFVVALVGFARAVVRSRRGDRALALLKEANAAMETSAQRRPEALAGDDLVLALGLFGMGVLAGGPLADLQAALRPKPGAASWGGTCGSGSSCGGGGCGGGCGGGGCGGCGG